jgi:hypothetical protein
MEEYGFASSGAQLSHNCQPKEGIGMKTLMAVVLVTSLLCLSAGTSFAATGSASATADLIVQEILEVTVAWFETGVPAQDFGTVPTGVLVSDDLSIGVNHNFDPTQTFSLGASVSKIMGPAWVDDVYIYDGADGRSWDEGTFGATQYFSNPIGGSSQSFMVPVTVNFDVDPVQTFGTFQFEIEMIVTSL